MFVSGISDFFGRRNLGINLKLKRKHPTNYT